MVGMMVAVNSKEKLAGLINSAKIASDIPSKLAHLHQLKLDLLPEEPVLLSELLPRILELQSDRFSPIRKFVTEMIGEIGFKNIDLLPQIVPLLITILSDETPAVARQSITCAIDLFRFSLVKVAMKGLHSSEIENSLQSLWTWMLKFKEEIYSIAVHGSGGMSLLAVKFVVEVILLYTPDPNVSSELSTCTESSSDFNISWLRGGHPLLSIRDLSTEASQSLGLLLDQLRFPKVKSLNNSKIIVLVNSLSTIAKRRPAFYGRILPVLLGLDRSGTIFNGLHAPGVHHALKNAFLTCLKCTHPGALPWRDPLICALREMKAGGLAEHSLRQVLAVNASVKEQDDDHFAKDEKHIVKNCDVMQSDMGRKRPGEPDSCDLTKDGEGSGKRARLTSTVSESEEPFKEMDIKADVSQHNVLSTGTTSATVDVDTGPAQQLVAMFGALVAQGEKAIGSLQILISSISADLLAEVVIANMRFLPPHQPDAGDGELLQNMNIGGSDTQVKYPSSFVADVLSLSTTFPPVASLLDSSCSLPDHMKLREEAEHAVSAVDGKVLSDGISHGSENAITPASLPASSAALSEVEEVCSVIPPSIHDVGNLESGIPGLASSVPSDELSETVTPSLASSAIEDSNQEHMSSLDPSSSMKISVSRERSEELSPKAVVTDVNSLASSSATSAALSFQLVLPKISAPVVDLVDEQKDEIQRLAFVRIVEAYKQIAVAGGLQARFSLLAYLGVEYPLELEPWKVLQNHILADYVNNEGHELTLRVLYRLFGEAEAEHDFFSSTTAASVYETFLFTVAETLKDSFPPSDKSLSRLLGEVPYLPKSVMNLLEGMCSPGNSENSDKDVQSGDRVTQGLSAVWSLILLRPPIRDVCLKIALQSTIHNSEEVRMKAIRLVANKLFPISSISQRIEDFSKEMLLSAISDLATDTENADGSVSESKKDAESEKSSNESSAISKDISPDSHLPLSQSVSSLTISEAQRRMSLYFALCTKKHSLFRQIFVMYKNASKAIKQAVHGHIPILVRTMGSSSDLLEIIADPPSGSESLVMQVLHILTDGTIPSPELVFTIRKLYNSKIKDVEIMIPVLPYLPKDEVMMVFPQIVNLPADKFQAALMRILQGSAHSGPVLSPAEVLIAIHGIDPERNGIPLKKVTDACNACFEQRQTFTQQVIAKVLNQLVEQIPLPLLFMRTVLQAIGAFPSLAEFIMEILSRLVGKQIWKYPKLWVGFLKCALLTKPQSFPVLLQLPPTQLENALNKTAALRAPLVAHATQPNIQSTLPRAILSVLGINTDTQNSSQANMTQSSQANTTQSSQANTTQTSPTNMIDSTNSEKEVEPPAEQSKESSVVS